MDNITVIIPAYKPGRELLETIRALTNVGLSDILVVDDGGGKDYAPIFAEIEADPVCTLLRHRVNRGKGAALKTAFAYFTEHRPHHIGVVTADADGQHLPEDILAVAAAMVESGSTVLGVRDFSLPDVPDRSKAGNRITRAMFRLFFGMKITDTQTGLRAFPRSALPVIASAEGDRYEFETNMLYLIHRYGLPLREVTISTVYINDNSTSHFRVVRDSVRIYAPQLKYLGGFLLAALLYGLLTQLLPTSATTTIAAGAIAGLLHYGMTALTVFDHTIRPFSLLKYGAVAVGYGALSVAVLALTGLLPEVGHALLHSVTSLVLWVLAFFVHFRMGHKWVFRNRITSPNHTKGRVSDK